MHHQTALKTVTQWIFNQLCKHIQVIIYISIIGGDYNIQIVHTFQVIFKPIDLFDTHASTGNRMIQYYHTGYFQFFHVSTRSIL